MLEEDPPPFFKAALVGDLEKTLGTSIGWNLRLPANAPANRSALDRAREIARSRP